MPILLRLAVRNLRQHLGKTLIIGAIIALGVTVLLVGTTLMDTASSGIEQSFTNNYTGDIIISGTSRGQVSLFGVQSVGGIDRTPVLPDYQRVWEYAGALPGVRAAAPQITGFGLVRREGAGNNLDENGQELGDSSFSFLFAIEPESYAQTFQNFNMQRGRYLETGERGIMLSVDRLRTMYSDYRLAMEDPIGEEALAAMSLDQLVEFIDVGDELRIIGGLSLGFPRIQVVPLVGIYTQVNQVEGVGSELVTYVDAETLRSLEGLSTVAAEVELTADQTSLLAQAEAQALDDIFSDFSFDSADSFLGDESLFDPFALDFGELEDLGDGAATAPESGSVGDSAVWQYILLRLDNSAATPGYVQMLNKWFAEQGIPAEAGDWKKAAGPFALTADVIRSTFNGAVILIGIVALLIMINTMFISVLERTQEIGTMRALGAQRRTIRSMFLWETLTITTVFGIIGIGIGLAILGILSIANIEATNSLLQVLFAGPTLSPVISIGTVLMSLVSVSIIGLVAHLFPVTYAVKIPPIRAMQNE